MGVFHGGLWMIAMVDGFPHIQSTIITIMNIYYIYNSNNNNMHTVRIRKNDNSHIWHSHSQTTARAKKPRPTPRPARLARLVPRGPKVVQLGGLACECFDLCMGGLRVEGIIDVGPMGQAIKRNGPKLVKMCYSVFFFVCDISILPGWQRYYLINKTIYMI